MDNTKKLNASIDILLDDITSKYERFCRSSKFGAIEEKVQKFADELNVEHGRKYIKIVAGNRVWGFINLGNYDFEYGDILKAKNFKTPSLNQARGNIFEDVYYIDWTGPLYISGYSAGGQRTCGKCGAEIKNLLGAA
jgi:hypothetical protein